MPSVVITLMNSYRAALLAQEEAAMRAALRRVGFDEDEIVQMEADKKEEGVQNRSFADAILSQAQVDFDAGEPR